MYYDPVLLLVHLFKAWKNSSYVMRLLSWAWWGATAGIIDWISGDVDLLLILRKLGYKYLLLKFSSYSPRMLAMEKGMSL